MNSLKLKWLVGWIVVLLSFGAPWMLFADEIGQSTCGKPILVQGDIQHAKPKIDVLKVAHADEPELYQEEVFGKSFTALVEGLSEGKYIVEIYLAETNFKAAGQRVFSVFSGQQVLVKDLDLFAEAGFMSEHMVWGEVVHQDDNINGPLAIRFEAEKNMAKFNAIKIRNDNGVVLACVTAAELRDLDGAAGAKIPEIKDPVIYTDSNLPVAQRVADLIRRMSLAEKVGQLCNSTKAIPRLGVPAYDYWNECLHGVARAGTATVFPQAIGMAAMWDTEMMHSVADTIATEGRAKNNEARQKKPGTQRYFGLTFWTPNINIFRDPRWGRGQETYGEDPFLAGTLGVSFIKGLQGDDPKYYKAVACAKHFAVHSGPEKIRHTFDAVPSSRDLYETYLPHFEMAVREGQVGSVMSAYNKLYGVPVPASNFLLTEILRDRWGFDGHVVSDCDGVKDVYKHHKYVETPEEAAAISLLAGNDLNCGRSFGSLIMAVSQGLLTETDIDRALTRVLIARFRLGLFDSPKECAYLTIPATDYNTPEHSQLALEAARKSMVLLKNDGLLPLKKGALKRIAVIGPNAADKEMLHGNYNGVPSNPVTILEGIRREVGASVTVDYAVGCPMAIAADHPFSVDQNADAQEALLLAKKADVVIFVGGLNAGLEGEQKRNAKPLVGFDKGDRSLIELPSPQCDLLKALKKTGKPVVFVNLTGSAIAMPWEAEHLSAILQAWYPGQNGGIAVADVLFGNVNPAGRLPITFYRSTKDLPDFTDYSMANRTYRYFKGDPLFAFGYGLSYTQFEYSKLKASASNMGATGRVNLTVNVKNTGVRDGEEVVQLYVRHLSSPVSQPLHSLAGFKRVALKAGEAKKVEFDLPASALRYWSVETNSYVVPAGEFEIQIGASSADIRQKTTCVIKDS
jgi:beta-glucosidase